MAPAVDRGGFVCRAALLLTVTAAVHPRMMPDSSLVLLASMPVSMSRGLSLHRLFGPEGLGLRPVAVVAHIVTGEPAWIAVLDLGLRLDGADLGLED